jgi:hypothetical protein
MRREVPKADEESTELQAQTVRRQPTGVETVQEFDGIADGVHPILRDGVRTEIFPWEAGETM